MADSKLTDLTSIPSIDNADLLYVVDVTGNTSYKITKADLLASVGASPKVLLETITNATAGDFDFGPALAGAIIPATYKRLVIEGYIRSDAATDDICYLFFNNDTTAGNYHNDRNAVHNGAASLVEASTPEICVVVAADALASSFTSIRIVIENYAGSNIKNAYSQYTGIVAAAEMWSGNGQLSHKTLTAAITRVMVRTNNHATDQLEGVLRLYGET